MTCFSLLSLTAAPSNLVTEALTAPQKWFVAVTWSPEAQAMILVNLYYLWIPLVVDISNRRISNNSTVIFTNYTITSSTGNNTNEFTPYLGPYSENNNNIGSLSTESTRILTMDRNIVWISEGSPQHLQLH